MLSGGGSLGIYKRYLLVETRGELQLWQAKEPTASSAEAHAPFNMVDLRTARSRHLADLDDARRCIDIKAIHHGKQHTGEWAVRFDGIDHVLGPKDPTRVAFDAKRVATDQVAAVAHLLGIECARAHANGFDHQHPKRDRSELRSGLDGESFGDWLVSVAVDDAGFIRKAHRLLRNEMDDVRDAVLSHGRLPALEHRVSRLRQKLDEAKQELESAKDSSKKKRAPLKRAVEKANRKLGKAERELHQARRVSRETDPRARLGG